MMNLMPSPEPFNEKLTHWANDTIFLWNKMSEPPVIRVDVSEDDTVNSIWYM